jgi:hypothetical protein
MQVNILLVLVVVFGFGLIGYWALEQRNKSND